MEKALAKFPVLEVARTGKICLKRGAQLLEVGGWGDGALRQRKQRESLAAQQQRQEQVSVCVVAGMHVLRGAVNKASRGHWSQVSARR